MPFIANTNAVDPSYPLYPIMSSIAIFLILLPAYWHFKSGNVGTILYITWTVIGNIIYLVNAVVWKDNLMNPSHFWCDLCTKLMIGMSVGIPTASLIINRRLYMIATIRSVNSSRSENRRNAYFELALGLSVPIVVMVLHVIVQGHRFDIFEGVGCWPSTYVTPVTIVAVFMWPVLLGMVSLVYAVLSIRAFLKQRKQFNALLQSNNSGLNASRYFRLMALASTEICFSLPFSIYLMVSDLVLGMHPWISWENTHYDFNRTEYIPFGIFALLPTTWILVNVSRYALPVGAYFFFAYLGLSGESGIFYRKQFWRVAGLFGFTRTSTTSPGASWGGRSVGTGPGQMRSLPPFATTASLSSTAKKDTSSLDVYPIPSAHAKSRSSSDSLDLEDEVARSSQSSHEHTDEPVHLTSPPDYPSSPSEVSKDVV